MVRRSLSLLILLALLAGGCAAGIATVPGSRGGPPGTNPPGGVATPAGTVAPPNPGVTPVPAATGAVASAGPGVIVTVPPAPSGGGPVPAPTRPPLTAAAAAALVLRSDVRFAGLTPRDAALIGQGSWYEVRPVGDGFEVTIHLGWGDCQAGCIDNHEWAFAVSSTGKVTLLSESGDPLPTSAAGVAGYATAGPVCPVERIPPDPQCTPRPVAGAVLIVNDLARKEVARTVTATDGSYHLSLGPGSYVLVAQPVSGLMGTPTPIAFSIPTGSASPVRVDVGYDTGIR